MSFRAKSRNLYIIFLIKCKHEDKIIQINNEVTIGGQAVIEGVMMRSNNYISVAVRKSDGTIALKRIKSRPWSKKYAMLKLPIFRGGVVLIESLVHGIRALSWSAEIAVEDEKGKSGDSEVSHDSKMSNISTIVTLGLGLILGLFLFFWLPLVFTGWVGVESGFAFNLVDGFFRLLMLGLYLGMISMWKEIRRVFQYHGAEHKSIFALENDCPLSVDGARPFSTLHPRCGTSFLLIVMLVSIVVFLFLGKPESYSDRFIRLLFVPVIAGISYEFIRLSSRYRNNRFARIFILPGLWLQKITTREPSDDQLEVGLTALRSAMGEMLATDNVVHYDNTGIISIDASSVESSRSKEVPFTD